MCEVFKYNDLNSLLLDLEDNSIAKEESSHEISLESKSYIFVDPPTFSGECKVMLGISVNIALSLIFEITPQSIMIMFMGHLPNENIPKLLAAVGLGQVFSEVVGFSLAWGSTSALWTLIPQAVGSYQKNTKKLIAIYVQQAFIISMTLCLLLTPLMYFAGDIMTLIGQNPELSEITNKYCRAVIPCVYFMTILAICQRVGQSFNLNTELMLSCFIPFIFLIPLNYLFAYTLDFGWIGVCYSLDLNMFLNLVLSLALLYYKGHGYVFIPLPMSIVCTKKGLCEYISIAIPGAIQGCISIWVGDIIVLFSGYIVSDTNIAMSATSIIYQVFFICIFASQGISNALKIRLGKYIGNSSILKAKRAINVSFVLLLPLLCVMVSLVTIFHTFIFELFTVDDSITKVINENILLLDIQIVLFGLYSNMCSIYSSMALQNYMAYIIVFGNWFVGISLQLIAFYVPFFDAVQYTIFGVQTIWFCSSFGYLCDVVILFTFYFFRLSIKRAINLSRNRIKGNLDNIEQSSKN